MPLVANVMTARSEKSEKKDVTERDENENERRGILLI